MHAEIYIKLKIKSKIQYMQTNILKPYYNTTHNRALWINERAVCGWREE